MQIRRVAKGCLPNEFFRYGVWCPQTGLQLAVHGRRGQNSCLPSFPRSPAFPTMTKKLHENILGQAEVHQLFGLLSSCLSEKFRPLPGWLSPRSLGLQSPSGILIHRVLSDSAILKLNRARCFVPWECLSRHLRALVASA